MTWLLILLLALNVGALVVVSLLYRRSRRAERARRVEGPNSEYTSQYVQDLEAKQRWEALDRTQLHELNREEFERMLAKVQTFSVRALSPQERAFMDRMVEAVQRVRRSGDKSDGGGSPRPLHA